MHAPKTTPFSQHSEQPPLITPSTAVTVMVGVLGGVVLAMDMVVAGTLCPSVPPFRVMIAAQA